MTNLIRKCCIVLLVLFAAGCDPLDDFEAGPFDGLEGTALITGSAMLVPEFLGSPQSEGMYFAGPVLEHGSAANSITGKNAEAVLAAFEKAYGGAPASPYWAHAYDATTLLLDAIESVAVEKGGKLYVDRLAQNYACFFFRRATVSVRFPLRLHQPYLRSPSVTSSVTSSPSRSTTIFTTSPGDCSRSA